ncbi:phosphatase domain-containing protein [Aeromicrobium sp. Sec7.5]|uniref:phosphatase domain-containing protein n=1 Tax=Aeromicrobium sp. Sec7.5 TaxID=3121276 RepID=UPI002FE4BC7C
MTRDAVIIDLDGTLVDTSGVEHLLEGEDRDFRAFQEAAVGCPPNPGMVAVAREQHEAGRAVLVVSSREFIWLDPTLDWLVQHDVPHDGVYLRIVGDYRQDVLVKRELLDDVVANGYRVVEAWDDKDRVTQMWIEQGIEGHETLR